MGCCGNHLCEACLNKIKSGSKPCPLCCSSTFISLLDLRVERQLLELTVSCVFKEFGCEWTGELRGLDCHVSDVCQFVGVSCPWACGVQVAKCMLEEHKLSLCPKRPWYACFKDADLRGLAEKVDTLTKEKQTLSTEVCVMKEKLDHVQDENETLKSEMNALKESQTSDIQGLRSLIDSLTTQLDELKTTLSSSSQTKPSPLEQKMCASPPTEPSLLVAPATFTVTEVSRRKKHNAEWYSPYFLSHPRGYQLQLRVDCGGIMDGKGSHISLFVYIAKGENDKGLKWPFEGSLAICLLDQVGSIHHERFVNFPKGLSTEIAGCVKDGVRAKRGQGFSQYISLDDLSSYIKDNRISFQVSVSLVKQTGLSLFDGLFRK